MALWSPSPAHPLPAATGAAEGMWLRPSPPHVGSSNKLHRALCCLGKGALVSGLADLCRRRCRAWMYAHSAGVWGIKELGMVIASAMLGHPALSARKGCSSCRRGEDHPHLPCRR